MKKIITLILAFLLASPVLATDDFITGLTDIPKMAGLSEDNEAATLFDVPELRIAQVYLQGTDVNETEFWQFYTESLPSLGWELEEDLEKSKSFVREDEVLKIEILKKSDKKDRSFIALFQITPKE